jgi:hypothetical protein
MIFNSPLKLYTLCCIISCLYFNMSPYRRASRNILCTEDYVCCHFRCGNSGFCADYFNFVTKLNVAVSKYHPVPFFFFFLQDIQMLAHALVITKRGRVRFCYGMREKNRVRGIQVLGAGGSWKCVQNTIAWHRGVKHSVIIYMCEGG